MGKWRISTKTYIYKNNQILHMEFNNIITELKISTEEFNNKLEQAEERISNLKTGNVKLSSQRNRKQRE